MCCRIFAFILIITSLGWHCTIDTGKEAANVPTIVAGTLLSKAYLVVFKKEKKIEIWEDSAGVKNKFVHYYYIKHNPDMPVGVFQMTNLGEKEGISFDFPGDFYLRKAAADKIDIKERLFIQTAYTSSISAVVSNADFHALQSTLLPYRFVTLLVFPNDARKTGVLDACFRCPAWMVEMYGDLEVQLQNFMLAKNNQKMQNVKQ
jgi:hypothetical protein